jgi:hypothetical protein
VDRLDVGTNRKERAIPFAFPIVVIAGLKQPTPE